MANKAYLHIYYVIIDESCTSDDELILDSQTLVVDLRIKANMASMTLIYVNSMTCLLALFLLRSTA